MNKLYVVTQDPPVGREVQDVGLQPSLLGMCVRILPRAWMPVSCEWYVLSGRGLYSRPNPCPEEPYRVYVCVCVCVYVFCVTECDQVNNNLLHLQ